MDKYARLLLIFSPIFVVLFSIWQGAYNIDPHHWGLMLSNAKDLYEGQTPYQDIFIQYGILTTILQAFAFGIGNRGFKFLTPGIDRVRIGKHSIGLAFLE